jgi:radical SAM-linked protein
MRIALPRPVGVASRDELLIVELSQDQSPADVLSKLSPEMPHGIALLSAESLAPNDKRLPCEACYTLTIEPSAYEAASRRAEAFLAKERVAVDRVVPKSRTTKAVDIRQYVFAIDVKADRVTWSQSITREGTARLSEVLEALGLPSSEHLHLVCREQVCYVPPDTGAAHPIEDSDPQ